MNCGIINFESFIQQVLFEESNKRKDVLGSGQHGEALIQYIVDNEIIGYFRSIVFLIIGKIFIGLIFGIKIRKLKKNRKNETPVIYVANHESHLDAPLILSTLSFKERANVAVAAAKDHFFKNWIQFFAISSSVNIFPLSRSGYCRNNFRTISRLIDDGKSILIFPEGTRSRNGKMSSFKKGVAKIIKDLNVPVVPIKIENTFKLLPYDKKIPKKGDVKIKFGDLLYLQNESSEKITGVLEETIKKL